MFFDIFFLVDERVLALYQRVVNWSTGITGRSDEHLRLAKLTCLTDVMIFITMYSIFLAKGLRLEPYLLAGRAFLPFLTILALTRISINMVAIKWAEKQTVAAAMGLNLWIFLGRRFGLLAPLPTFLTIFFSSVTTWGWCLLFGLAIYFLWSTSPAYFLSCQPPARRKIILISQKTSPLKELIPNRVKT